MANQLANTTYQRLVSDISEIYQKVKLHTAKTVNKIIVSAYWRIGKRIVKEEQDNNHRAQYGARLLENLSRDLTGKFGNGFSVSNLRYMRQLYVFYPIHHPRDELDWTHLRHLLGVKDKYKRDIYKRRAIEENWSTRYLLEKLKKDKVKLPINIRRRTDIARAAGRLSFERGELYTYKIIQPEYINTQVGNVVVDCGFYISAEVPVVEITKPKVGQIIKTVKTAKGKYIFNFSQAQESQLYTYKALVERVVDADTIWVNIDVGFNIWIRQKLRLRSINAPELSTQKGQKAKKFVESKLANVAFIVIKTHGSDKYDRYLVDIFYSSRETDAETMLEQGTYLNQELLDLGLAFKL